MHQHPILAAEHHHGLGDAVLDFHGLVGTAHLDATHGAAEGGPITGVGGFADVFERKVLLGGQVIEHRIFLVEFGAQTAELAPRSD
ncbi:hypothetical protein D3C71_1540870 [compost metagenome]